MNAALAQDHLHFQNHERQERVTHILRYLEEDQRLEGPKLRYSPVPPHFLPDRQRGAQHREKCSERASGLEHEQEYMRVVHIVCRQTVDALGLGDDGRDRHGPGDGYVLRNADPAAPEEGKHTVGGYGGAEQSSSRDHWGEEDGS